MWSTVELPLWLVILGAVFAVIAVIDRILGPWLRWVLRRRFKRAVARLNDRLAVKIEDFKLVRREVLIDRLVHDHQVLGALEEAAIATGKPVDLLAREVETYAREIVPSFSSFMYFQIGTRFSRWISRMLYQIRVAPFDPGYFQSLDDKTSLVFVMNHRSNADYLLATYLAQKTSHLSYAVGEWARVWPLSRLIRSMGAYFIRRRSRNPLYRKVLARYVHMATEAGVTQAIFPEGGLSRDGGLQPAKLGLISYIVEGFDLEGQRDVVFIPVGVNYDRVLEDRVLLSAELDERGKPRFSVGLWGSFLFGLQLTWKRAAGQWHRFGYAAVNFGKPISLKAFLAETVSDDPVTALGTEVMTRIGQAVPIVPVPLLAKILLAEPQGLTEADLTARVEAALAEARERGVGLHNRHPRADRITAEALAILRLRALITEPDGLIRPASDETTVLEYYARSLAFES